MPDIRFAVEIERFCSENKLKEWLSYDESTLPITYLVNVYDILARDGVKNMYTKCLNLVLSKTNCINLYKYLKKTIFGYY